MRLFRFIGRLFGYLWRWLDAIRRTVFNLVLLLLIGVLVAVWWRPTPPMPGDVALVLRPSGALVEQIQLDDPISLLAAGAGEPQTALRDLLDAVNAASDDDRIKALVLETDGLGQAGLSKLAELRAAIAHFKDSGKPVFARGEHFSQGQYYLASVADEVHVSPDGFVLLRGLARYVTYYKNALDKLGVDVHVFRVGEYKSFSEPFTRSDMSEEDRASSRDLLDGLWNVFREDVAASRELTPVALDGYILGYGDALAQANGNAARAAHDAGLVDRFSTRDEWRAYLSGKLGNADDGQSFRSVGVARYLADVRSTPAAVPHQVAVLVAQGAIVDGNSAAPGTVGGDSFAELIRNAREDDRIQALVVRIDSPGGSAWASEVIRRELEVTRRAGKPVVASMSSTAASGGYWIAAGAEEIWAHPATLTGSIGIFAMLPDVSQPFNRLGLSIDGVSTGPLAGALDPRRPLDPTMAQALQLGIEHGYRRFIETVANARGMTAEEVDHVARGRVWTGTAASQLGLVDGLGGLNEAVAAAAKRANLADYDVVWPTRGLSPRQLLMQQLSELAQWSGMAGPSVEEGTLRTASMARPFGQMLSAVERDISALLRWNDPQHAYAHCLCDGISP